MKIAFTAYPDEEFSEYLTGVYQKSSLYGHMTVHPIMSMQRARSGQPADRECSGLYGERSTRCLSVFGSGYSWGGAAGVPCRTLESLCVHVDSIWTCPSLHKRGIAVKRNPAMGDQVARELPRAAL